MNVQRAVFASCRPAAALSVALLAMVLAAMPASAQDAGRGGLLYDKWWAVNGAPEPSSDHPLYPAVGQKSGSTTHRCKECHGWDYRGVEGAYATGSHFTGIGGVWGSPLSASEMFYLIRNPDGDGTGGTTVNGHGFGAIGLADSDIADLVEFLQTRLLDIDLYVDANGRFLGDAGQGNVLFEGAALCNNCHGSDGTAINFGTTEDPVWVGTIATVNPWELMHKVRFGQPDSFMPGFLSLGGTDQEAADIGLHTQLGLPATLPPAVPDGAVGSPITVDRVGTTLELDWDTATCGGEGYHILYGSGDDLPVAPTGAYGLRGSVCATNPPLPYAWTDSPDPAAQASGLIWFLVVPDDANGYEGSWGTDSAGYERGSSAPDGGSGRCGLPTRSVANRCGR